MLKIPAGLIRLTAIGLLPLLAVQPVFGWGHIGHEMINRMAVANLPAVVPAFLRDAKALETIEYLGPEPDRWKNRAEDELNQEQSPDHYIDLEWADLVGPLPRKRYDFIRALEATQPKYPKLTLTPEKVGMQPWEVEEIYERLKAALREYRKLSAANQNVQPVETAILFYAGWLGHYVADGSQPLHTTIQYNGWTGENPNGYDTGHTIHAQFEATYVSANVKPADVQPLVSAAPPKVLNDEWADYLAYLRHTNSEVEKTYQIQKAGGFTDAGTPEAKAFTDQCLAAGAIELRDLIYTAWIKSADPVQEYKGPS